MTVRLLLLFALTCGGVSHAHAQVGDFQVTNFELVGGQVLVETLRGHDRGQYLAVRPVGRRDTLWLWMEGVTRSRGPSREAARAADLVVWCYPGQYGDDRHVLPSVEEVTVITQKENGKRWIWFLGEHTAQRVLPNGNSRTKAVRLFLP